MTKIFFQGSLGSWHQQNSKQQGNTGGMENENGQVHQLCIMVIQDLVKDVKDIALIKEDTSLVYSLDHRHNKTSSTKSECIHASTLI